MSAAMAKPKRFVYVLNSESDPGRYYSGVTSNVRARLAAHNEGRCPHTSRWTPWRVIVVAVLEVWFRLRVCQAPFQVGTLTTGCGTVWRDLRQQPSRTPVNRASASTDNLAFPNCANHRGSSRLPSRRQPFRIRSLKTREEGAPENAPVHLRNAIRISSSPGAVYARRRGDDTLQAWRERPRLWPRAWSQTRSISWSLTPRSPRWGRR